MKKQSTDNFPIPSAEELAAMVKLCEQKEARRILRNEKERIRYAKMKEDVAADRFLQFSHAAQEVSKAFTEYKK